LVDTTSPNVLSITTIYELGQHNLTLLNADRAFFPTESDGADPLAWDDELWGVALCHAIDMCNRSFFAHSNPDGADIVDRLSDGLGAELGEQYWATGENLAYFSLTGHNASLPMDELEEVVEFHHRGYMDECQCRAGCTGKSADAPAGHRTNVLRANFREVGAAEWFCPDDGRFYNAQAFWRVESSLSRANPYCDGDFTADPPSPFSSVPAGL